jgi:RNA polymerase sigma-70 factor, ECF subfamily
MDDVAHGLSSAKPELTAIFEEHFVYVWKTLGRLGVRSGDLEDVAQEVFLRIYKRLGDYDVARPMRPWIFGFAYRMAADYRRLARHRTEVLGAPIEATDASRGADERLEVEEERAIVEAALDAVEFDRRAVLVMHDVDEVPIPVVARELGLPVNTTYSRLRLAREDFVAALGRLRKVRGAR